MSEPEQHPDVVIGGGVGGLTVALMMARAGRPVVLFERDELPPDDDVEAAFTHPRTGTPQARHTHGLLARMTKVLVERLPDVLDGLRARGATEAPLEPDGPLDPDDIDPPVFLVRRTTLDLVLREAVRHEPGIELRGGTAVTGLVGTPANGDGPADVRGVVLDDGTTIEADTVIASTGRRGAWREWLAELGAEIPETERDTHVLYLSRWYRLPEIDAHDIDNKMAGDLGFVKYLAVPGDNRTFSITIACDPRDTEMRTHLLDDERFDRTARLIPGPAEFLAAHHLEPISGVEPMGGLVNRLRHFLDDDGRPLVTGFHAIGDAHTCTNPLYGRGCSLAMVQASLVTDAITAHPADDNESRTARALDYEAATKVEVEPWFRQAVTLDKMVHRQAEAQANGEAPAGGPAAGLDSLMAGASDDPVLARGVLRVFNLLMLPDQLMADPAFIERMMAAVAKANEANDTAEGETEPAPAPPTREQVLSLATS